MTVLLSSHILAEVQQVCDSVSIIGNGRLLASGAVDDLLGESSGTTRVRVADPATAAPAADGGRLHGDARRRDARWSRAHEPPGADHPGARRRRPLRHAS